MSSADLIADRSAQCETVILAGNVSESTARYTTRVVRPVYTITLQLKRITFPFRTFVKSSRRTLLLHFLCSQIRYCHLVGEFTGLATSNFERVYESKRVRALFHDTLFYSSILFYVTLCSTADHQSCFMLHSHALLIIVSALHQISSDLFPRGDRAASSS